MKSYHHTLTHQQHTENTNMTYEEKIAKEKLEKQHQENLDALNGVTAKVKSLKSKVLVAENRTNSIMFTNGEREFNPRGARQSIAQSKIRESLMQDQSLYFGTLDHAIPRTTYEYESLNSRQQALVQKQYPWMIEELRDEPIPATLKDEWSLPLEDAFSKLSKKEQSNFSPMERMTMVSYEELVGADAQPVYVEDGAGVSDESVMSSTEE